MIASRPFRWGCLLLVALCVVTRALEGLFYVWNDVRFSRAYALVHGLDVYGSSDSGVISGIIYGPVGFLLYAPAALWSTPTPALFTAGLISAAVTLGPAALVIRYSAAAAGKPSWTLPLFTLTVLHFHAAAATVGVWMIHTDAAALGLSCLALYAVLHHPLGKAFSPYLATAAAAAALAVWAKQTAPPILLIPALYLLVQGASRGAAWVLGLGFAFSLILAIAFSALYGAEDLWRAMVTIPSHHSRYPGLLLHDGARVTDLIEMLCLPLAGLVCLVVLEGPDQETGGGSRPSWPIRAAKWGETIRNGRGWPLFVGTALLMLPMACLGRMKAGGSANNYALLDYFLSLGLVMLFLAVSARPSLAGKRPRRALQGAMAVLLIWLAAPTAMGLAGRLYGLPLHQPIPSATAYRAALADPGTIYFPWRPLAALMAEGRSYHTVWGVMEREAAGLTVGESHFRAHLPPTMRGIAVLGSNNGTSDPHGRNVSPIRGLPEFGCKIYDPDLPGWDVFVRGPANCNGVARDSSSR